MSFALDAKAVSLRFGTVQALDGVSVAVPEGALVAVVGESGSGKTSLLRCFNRLLVPASGTVRVGGVSVAELDPVTLRRRIGYVQQSGGLLPHWTVLRNVALVPRLRQEARPDTAAAQALELVGLEPSVFATRYPHELSGGQRQRVALARALAAKQDIVLLDEPFGALDAIVRGEVHEAFERVRAERRFSALLITHDLAEAARLGDRIAVMRAGRIEQEGTIDTLRSAPATSYVAELLARAAATARALYG